MTEKSKKTIITVIVIAACACIIGSTVAGLFAKKDNKDNKDSTNSTAAVQVVDADLNAL